MNVKYLFYILGFILISCNSNEEVNLKEKATEKINYDSLKVDSLKTEDFFEFFEKFTWERKFSISRTNFPINICGKEYLSSIDWKGWNYFDKEECVTELLHDSIEEQIIFTNHFILDLINLAKKGAKRHYFEIKNKKWTLGEIKTIKTGELADKDFLNFLYKFSIDSVFQETHTIFPLIYKSYSDVDFSETEELIVKDSSGYVNTLSYFTNLMCFDQKKSNSNLRIIFFKGRDNGIHVKYYFKKIKGTWYYYKNEDYST